MHALIVCSILPYKETWAMHALIVCSILPYKETWAMHALTVSSVIPHRETWAMHALIVCSVLPYKETLPGYHQYFWEVIVSCSRTQHGDPHSGRRVVSLSKIYLPHKSTGNTQEEVAPS